MAHETEYCNQLDFDFCSFKFLCVNNDEVEIELK